MKLSDYWGRGGDNMAIKNRNSRGPTCSDKYLTQIFENLPDPIKTMDSKLFQPTWGELKNIIK
jgi:hypothetical protein